MPEKLAEIFVRTSLGEYLLTLLKCREYESARERSEGYRGPGMWN